MSTNTSNYNLVKQDEAEFYDVKVVNQNLDKIDTAIKDAKDSAASSKTEVVDNLTSTAADKALSAKQGKVVNDNFIQLSSDFNNWHGNDYVPTKTALTQHLAQNAQGAHTIANITGLQSVLDSKQSSLPVENRRKITFGTTEPTGGVNGDIYFQYE